MSNNFLSIRVSHRKRRGTKSARYLFKCGCCDEAIEVYYDDDPQFGLEINGVNGSIKNWRKLLLPLLHIKRAGKGFVDALT